MYTVRVNTRTCTIFFFLCKEYKLPIINLYRSMTQIALYAENYGDVLFGPSPVLYPYTKWGRFVYANINPKLFLDFPIDTLPENVYTLWRLKQGFIFFSYVPTKIK